MIKRMTLLSVIVVCLAMASMVLVEDCDSSDAATMGATFTADTEEGITVTYMVTVDNTEVQIGNGTDMAVSETVSGTITIPSQVSDGIYTYAVVSVGCNAFDSSEITSITLPDSVTVIDESAFYMSSLTSITIPGNVTSIGTYAFMGCTSLTSVTIPKSVTSIGEGAFSYCSALSSIAIPCGVISIGNAAFSNCSSLESVTLPCSATSIGDSAFNDCSSIKIITIPSNVTSMGISVFHGCTSLESVTVLGNIIGVSAFDDCTSLASVKMPDDVTIQSYAFSNCASLVSVTITVSSEGLTVGGAIDEYFDVDSMEWVLPGQSSRTVTNLTITGISDFVLDPNNVSDGIYGECGSVLTYKYDSFTDVYYYDCSGSWVLTSEQGSESLEIVLIVVIVIAVMAILIASVVYKKK